MSPGLPIKPDDILEAARLREAAGHLRQDIAHEFLNLTEANSTAKKGIHGLLIGSIEDVGSRLATLETGRHE